MGEGGDTDYISQYNVQGKTKSFLSTSERLRSGGVGVNCVGVMTRKDKGVFNHSPSGTLENYHVVLL